MALYAGYAPDTSLPLSRVYSSAQKLSASACGPDYARAVAVNSAATLPPPTLLLGLVLALWSST